MDYSSEQNQKRTIEEIEAEIEHEVAYNSSNSNQIPVSSPFLSQFLTPIKNWVISLPPIGKILVGFAGVMIGLSVIKTTFMIVTSLISLIVIGSLIYLGYKFLIKSN